MIRTVHLHGALSQFSDEPLQFVANDLRDVLSYLKFRFSDFKKFINDNPVYNLILTDKDKKNPRPIYQEFAFTPFGSASDLHIFPKVEGEDPLTQALIVAGVAAGTAAAITTVVINIAVSIAVGLVMSALAPKPSTGDSEAPASQPSFLFNGPENVQEQGYQVPVVYGTHMTGSVIVSAGISVENLPIEKIPDPVYSAYIPPVEGQFDGRGSGGNG